MKKLFLVLALFSAVAFSLPASASAATNPGVKPGNFFYFFDTTFEQISLFFTFSPEKKAEKALAYADERLAEVEALADEQNPNAVKTAITNYESNIALAAEKSKEVQDKEKAENLFTLIADNTSKNQEVLSAVLVKVPEEAKEAITRAIEASRKGQEEAVQQIAELKSEIEQLKKEVAELKAKDETQTKAVEELDKQKSGSVSVPPKLLTPPATSNQSQTLPKANEQQNIPSTSQQPANTITLPPPVAVTPPAPTETLEITSVSVVPDMTSAKAEWQTNKPTESKIFISGGNLSSKIFNSVSGLSTRHSVAITGLTEETTYSYEIEAIAGGVNAAKKQGGFKTLPPPPLFEFNPIIRIGGTNPNGTHWYPQLIDTGSGGYIASDIGHVYFSINENYDGCVWGIKDPITNISPGGWNSYHKSSWERPVGTKIPSGQIIDTTGYSSGKVYVYEFTCRKSGFRENTVIGEFIMPSPQIYTEKRIKQWPDSPSLHGEFMFWHYGASLEGSVLNLKIKITLANPLVSNELKFYKSGIANLWQTFSNVSNGNILEINSFPSNYQLVWSYSGNPDDLSLEIIEGTATKNGANVLFKFN